MVSSESFTESNDFMYIDSHAHLFNEDFGRDLHDVILRAQEAGVDKIIVPGTNEKTSHEALELAAKYEHIYACVGFHPHDAGKATDKLIGEIELLAAYRKVVGIGEIGLDYHYDFYPHDTQIAVFREQIEMAVRMNLPIIVHTRESLKETVEVVEEVLQAHPQWKSGEGKTTNDSNPGRGVFHCFTGTASEAVSLFNNGFVVSYPGIVTFKNSPVAETVSAIGCRHLLLETDSPYMSPVPLRGKRNEPANILHIARKIAELLNIPESDVARTTSLNAIKLFGLAE
jgi:TatD DNase family protein